MRLTVIGCSGSIPGPDSPASSYLVEERKASVSCLTWATAPWARWRGT